MLEIKSKRKKENLLNNKLIRVQVKISAKISTRLFQGKTIIKSGAQLQSGCAQGAIYKNPHPNILHTKTV